jgi:glycosyltransferase involved in cell wall biosynthesis
MKNKPLVSVVIPTYNRAPVIVRTIENVFEQTYGNIEIVVVDDGSMDDTQAKLRQFGNRIRVITQTNGGPAAARNRGIEASRGEIVAFQDSDDLWMPTKIERQVALLEQSDDGVVACITNANMYFADRPPITSFEMAALRPAHEEGIWLNVPEVLATTFVLFIQCVAIRTNVLQRLGGFDESYEFMEDYEMPLRLALAGNRWAFIREPMVVWRQGSPESLYLKAMKQEIAMKECEVRSREVALEMAKGEERYRGLCNLLGREIKRNRREIAIAKLSRSSVPGAAAAAKVLRRLERYRKAAYRRTPAFPKMKVERVAPSDKPLLVTAR